MIQYAIRRFLYLIPLLMCMTVLVASLTHFIPGDPVEKILPEFATEAQKQDLRSHLGLNKSLINKVTSYFGGIFYLDFGKSVHSGKNVTTLISERIIPTIELAICSLIIALLLSLPLGIISAMKPNSLTDFFATGFSLIGVSMPNFWLGPLLILFFAVYLGILPASERDGFLSYILPSVTLGTALAAILSRMTRTAFLDELNADYVRTALSKGLSKTRVLLVHVFRNAGIPIVTILGLQFGVLLSGAIITEKIFDWPGLGSLMIEAIQGRDYPVIQALVLLFSTTYLIVNLLTDITYAIIDPRIKLK